jgi:hypothetical protein
MLSPELIVSGILGLRLVDAASGRRRAVTDTALHGTGDLF